MSDTTLGRRDFHKLTAAAFTGLVAGAGTSALAQDDDGKKKLTVDPLLLSQEPHVCRGLNTCKGKGKGGDNACAGQGACTSVAAHACNGQNDCKGQGGCGGYPGQNTCKEKGHCNVPLKKNIWTHARTQFEEVMADLGKKVGKPPKAED
ncbi:MAG: hypothetical protein KY476_23475 [Planctomycetes bacterium]|nr:hypothetical protein [Planctomycetota bacterium]